MIATGIYHSKHYLIFCICCAYFTWSNQYECSWFSVFHDYVEQLREVTMGLDHNSLKDRL